MIRLSLKARDWHGWLSVLLLAPLLLIGLTALFIAHQKALGLKEIEVGAVAGWLPGYATPTAAGPADIRSALALGDGRQWLGTRNGAWELRPGQPAVQHLAGLEVRGLASGAGGLVAATKSGLWRHDGASGEWQRALGGEFWSVGVDADGGLSASSRERGVARSADGRQWARQPMPALPAAAEAERLTMNKLMLDLHTGKAFFGKDGEWIWIDLLAAVWAFLGGTGIYLWWRTQTKRRDAALNRHGAPAGGKAVPAVAGGVTGMAGVNGVTGASE